MTTVDRITVDVIERHVPPIKVADSRGSLGGTAIHGVLRVYDDEGLEGQCIIGALGDQSGPLISELLDRVAPLIVGMDPDDREWLWSELDDITGHERPVHPVWSWIDIALWDLAGKRLGVPVYRMLGRADKTVVACATHPPMHETVDGYVAEIRTAVAAGFRMYKLHPGALPAELVVRVVQEARSEVGDAVGLALDPNNAYDLDTALRIGRSLDATHFAWFEDPLPAARHDALAVLARSIDTPVAVGDESSVLLRESAHLVALHGLRIIRGSAKKLGITGLRKLCAFLEASDRRCEIGPGGNPSINAANLHVAMSAHNAGTFEHWMPASAHQFAALDYIEPDGQGLVQPSERPGLGVLLDEDWIDHHRVGRQSTAAGSV